MYPLLLMPGDAGISSYVRSFVPVGVECISVSLSCICRPVFPLFPTLEQVEMGGDR